MILIKPLLIIFIPFIAVSCISKTKDKRTDAVSALQKDTIHLLNTLKSYEPAIYKGTVPEQFYINRGAYDWWRFPLVYPYSIGCIDVTEYGCIYSDKGKTDYDAGGSIQPVTDYFDKFIFDKSYFVGCRCKGPFSNDTAKYFEQYFIFPFSNGVSKEISGKQDLIKKLEEIKFIGDTAFITIKDFENKL
jgi:hypothetical protein